MMMRSHGTSAMLRAGMCHTAYSTTACAGRVPYNKYWALTVLPDAEAVQWTFKYSYPTGSDDNISGLNKEAILRSLGFRPPPFCTAF